MLVDAALGGKLHPLLLLTLVAKPNLQNIGFGKGILKRSTNLKYISSASDIGCKTKPNKKPGLKKAISSNIFNITSVIDQPKNNLMLCYIKVFRKYYKHFQHHHQCLFCAHPNNILFQVKFFCDGSNFLSTGPWLS